MFPSSTTSKKVRITTADVATSTTDHLDLAPATACTIRQLSVLCSSSTCSRRTIESVEPHGYVDQGARSDRLC